MPDAELTAVLDAGVGYDAEELADLTERLCSELRDLDIDSVAAAADSEAPEGAKGVELLGIGGLVVRFALRAEVLRSVAHTAAAWLGRQQARSVKLTLDGDTLLTRRAHGGPPTLRSARSARGHRNILR